MSRALLASGATIREMNCVRRHLSAIKGGRLAAACHPARVLTLLISDVPGDRPIDIASGPTVADPTTSADALGILRRYGIDLPEPVRELLESGRGESVKPGDPRLARAAVRIIAAPQMALEAAAAVARAAGIAAHILGDAIEGEARDVGKVFAGIAPQVAERNQPFAAPCVLLSGRRDHGHRARKRPRRPQCRVFAVAGDRPRRSTAHSRAGRRHRRGRRRGGDRRRRHRPRLAAPRLVSGSKAHGHARDNDAHSFFTALGDSVITGPTLTNVNDFRAILIEG